MHERTTLPLASLRAHPRNYRAHPSDQLEHLVQSLREHGVYRNVVVARDNTILAGHGVVEAAKMAGMIEVPGVRLDISPNDPKALKLLAADNEVGRFAEVDDRQLTELLKEIAQTDDAGLFGTGYDEAQLANLLFVTRPATEIADFDAASQWVGLPEFEGFSQESVIGLALQCATAEDRDRLVEQLGLQSVRHGRRIWSAHWPPKPMEDPSSIMFDG
jgi:hypothetical protein